MFSYYGSKRQLAHHYAEPQYDLIVEPFAGSAGYSLHGDRWQKDVLLLDRDTRLVGVWEWLIGEATRAAILALPELRVGETSTEFLSIASVATRTVNSLSTTVVTPSMVAAWEQSRSYLAADISKIKHWHVRSGEYADAPDVAATWAATSGASAYSPDRTCQCLILLMSAARYERLCSQAATIDGVTTVVLSELTVRVATLAMDRNSVEVSPTRNSGRARMAARVASPISHSQTPTSRVSRSSRRTSFCQRSPWRE